MVLFLYSLLNWTNVYLKLHNSIVAGGLILKKKVPPTDSGQPIAERVCRGTELGSRDSPLTAYINISQHTVTSQTKSDSQTVNM